MLGRDAIHALFAPSESLEVLDPWTYHRQRSDLRVRVPWPEHPAGAWHLVTNSLGLREDHEVDPESGGPRIVVVGDSHTNGYCDNGESYPNVIEVDLRRRCGSPALDVVNAANGGFGPYQMLGAVEKHAALRPDLYVVALFAGNDFLDARNPKAWFEGREHEPGAPTEGEEIERAHDLSPALTTQGLQTVLFARQRPHELAQLVTAVAGLVAEMRQAAERADARLVVVVLPSALDVPGAVDPALLARVRERLALSDADLAAGARAGDALGRELERIGIEAHDLRARLVASGHRCFWRADYHLDVDGHRVVAGALSELLGGCGWIRGR